ncbi:MAG: hypothetical protein ACFFDF_20215 [Candidatus Odinarchaeota archaeon]
MDDKKDLSYPSYAFIALARRGMEKISLDQCFLENCDNQDPTLLEPFKKELIEDEKKVIEKVHIKCKKCNRVFILKFETVKKVAQSTKSMKEKPLSMGLVYALDENEKNLGHIGYF